jgi:predicted  nucleic acid-binding Zn-ribbon protein
MKVYLVGISEVEGNTIMGIFASKESADVALVTRSIEKLEDENRTLLDLIGNHGKGLQDQIKYLYAEVQEAEKRIEKLESLQADKGVKEQKEGSELEEIIEDWLSGLGVYSCRIKEISKKIRDLAIRKISEIPCYVSESVRKALENL